MNRIPFSFLAVIALAGCSGSNSDPAASNAAIPGETASMPVEASSAAASAEAVGPAAAASSSAPSPIPSATPTADAVPSARPATVVAVVAKPAAFAQCAGCHNAAAGAGSKIGPNLYGIYGAKAASGAGFVYSDALRQSAVTWTGLSLDKWLANPAAFIPGNKMTYSGMTDAADRAAVIAYLKTTR